jgi:hypothetical protein
MIGKLQVCGFSKAIDASQSSVGSRRQLLVPNPVFALDALLDVCSSIADPIGSDRIESARKY